MSKKRIVATLAKVAADRLRGRRPPRVQEVRVTVALDPLQLDALIQALAKREGG